MKKVSDWKANANKKRTRSLIGQTLAHIFEIHDERRTAAHLVTITRSRGIVVGKNPDGTPKYRDFYYLSEDEVLKVLEEYLEELDREALEGLRETQDELGS